MHQMPTIPVRERRSSPTCLWVAIGCGVLGCVSIPFVAILAAILFPVFAKAREKAEESHCLSNVKQLCVGMMMYAQDYDQHFPITDTGLSGASSPVTWPTLLYPYVKNGQVYICPDSTEDGQSYDPATTPHATTGNPGVSYGMNDRLNQAGLKGVTSPRTTVALYDSLTDKGACYGNCGAGFGNVHEGTNRVRANHLGSDPGTNGPAGDGFGAIGFADGHAKMMQYSAVAVANAGLGPDDVRWHY
jgi:hypothetical protein